MSETYENKEMENQEVFEMKKSDSFKGKVIAFLAGAVTCGVGALVYSINKKKAAAEEVEDDEFEEDYFEDEEVPETNEESSEEN